MGETLPPLTPLGDTPPPFFFTAPGSLPWARGSFWGHGLSIFWGPLWPHPFGHAHTFGTCLPPYSTLFWAPLLGWGFPHKRPLFSRHGFGGAPFSNSLLVLSFSRSSQLGRALFQSASGAAQFLSWGPHFSHTRGLYIAHPRAHFLGATLRDTILVWGPPQTWGRPHLLRGAPLWVLHTFSAGFFSRPGGVLPASLLVCVANYYSGGAIIYRRRATTFRHLVWRAKEDTMLPGEDLPIGGATRASLRPTTTLQT